MRIKIEIDTENEKSVNIETSEGKEETKEEFEPQEQEEVELTEEELERYAAASDLANCCEYLEDSELIKIKLIIQKCMKRKAAEEE